MALPNALVVGPMKCGTSWLHDYFAARGDIMLPSQVKETFFFDRHFHRGLGWYEERFPKAPPRGATSQVIEVAPSLFHSELAPSRIAQALPNLSLVFTFRDPVSRAWSHYKHMQRYGYTNADLREAVAQFPEIVDASCYEKQLERWRAELPLARFLTLEMELLKTDPQQYCDTLCEFLGIASVNLQELSIEKSNVAARPMSFRLARIGRWSAHKLRDAGLYSVVNSAKALGLKELFFGKPSERSSPDSPTDYQRQWLSDEIARRASEPLSAGQES